MPELEHLEDQYLKTRHDTDLWQSAQIADQAGTVKLEVTVPPKEPRPDSIPGGRRTEEELAAMGLSYDQIGRKEKTVESPEVQAIRSQYKEQTSKFFSGETALEEIGKAGRKLAEAVAPGVELAGRAIGLDEEGAGALSQGFTEFLAGLPGQNESDLHAGIETALAALPMVGATIRSGKAVGKAVASIGTSLAKGKAVDKVGTLYDAKEFIFGDSRIMEGIQKANPTLYRELIALHRKIDGADDATIEKLGNSLSEDDAQQLHELVTKAANAADDMDIRSASHASPRPFTSERVALEFQKAAAILKTERGSVQVGKGKKAADKGIETPITWEEAIKIDDLRNQANADFKDFSANLSTQRQGVRTDVQTTAESLGPDALTMEAFLNLAPGTILKDSNVIAAKRIFKTLGEEVRQKAQWMAANPNDQKALLGLLEAFPLIQQATVKIAGVFAEPPRSTRMLNKLLPTTEKVDPASAERVRISDPYINQWLEFFKQQDALAKTGAPALTKEKLVETLAGMKTDEEFMQAAKILAQPTKWDMFIEYWINGLLSGPATHATNILSNAATIAWGIPERGLAAMFSKEVRPSEPLAMLGGILEAQGDAWRLAWQAFKAEESQMGAGKLEGPARAITADALELTGVPGRAVDFLGSLIRLPGRTLLAADDYFKSIAFRAELRALAKRESFAQVSTSGLSGASARSRMRDIEQRILTNPPEAIEDAAKEYASYVTFTRDLGEAGQRVQALANTPVGRLVLPFVRTPTNIFKYAGERTPLAFASQAVRDEIAAGGQRRALALAKISLGAMTMSYIMMLASEGIIEGGGPKDKALRQQWLEAGHLPYSWKVGDTRYSFARIEPMGSLFSIAADVADIMGQLPQKDAEQLAAAVVIAISRNVANKTFVKGLAGTLNAVASQDINEVKSFFEKELPTIMPMSTGMSQTTRVVDPVMREVNSILDAFKAKTPGLSDSLPPRRNLWGEPIALQGGLGPDLISPIYTSTMKLDPVSQELVRLELPIGMPAKTIEGVPLTGPDGPWEYDALVVLQGSKPILNDMPLKQWISEQMRTDLYRGATDGKDGGKKVLIQGWITDYRDRAKFILSDRELSQEYLGKYFPDLITQIQKSREKQAQKFNQPVGAR